MVWADFGMPGWFFVLTQIWLWTLGLPAMLGVVLLSALWGIPARPAVPLWLFIPCVVVAAVTLQTLCFLLIGRVIGRRWKRLAVRKP